MQRILGLTDAEADGLRRIVQEVRPAVAFPAVALRIDGVSQVRRPAVGFSSTSQPGFSGGLQAALASAAMAVCQQRWLFANNVMCARHLILLPPSPRCSHVAGRLEAGSGGAAGDGLLLKRLGGASCEQVPPSEATPMRPVKH